MADAKPCERDPVFMEFLCQWKMGKKQKWLHSSLVIACAENLMDQGAAEAMRLGS